MNAVWGDETIRLLREANEVLHNANEEAMSDTKAACLHPGVHIIGNVRMCATCGHTWRVEKEMSSDTPRTDALHDRQEGECFRLQDVVKETPNAIVPLVARHVDELLSLARELERALRFARVEIGGISYSDRAEKDYALDVIDAALEDK